MNFEFFDRNSEFAIREGNLPHWYQPGVTYFVTFRTEDSVPAELADSWYRRRLEWLTRHGMASKTNWNVFLRQLSEELQREFDRTFTAEFMEYLDRGHGACVLKRPELARIVGDSLQHFDNERYHLGDYVVMPNHVHLLVCLIGNTEIEAQCYSWKKFTAAKINRVLGRSGRFWQEESFDHLVRSPEQFEFLQRYISDNPIKAGLRLGEFLYYQRK